MKTKTKKIKLPRAFRTKWLEMLTSGRYKQAEGLLFDDNVNNENKTGYCCLGLAGRALNIKRNDLISHGMPSDLDIELARTYPSCILKTFKISERKQNTKFSRKLANMNDGGKTFKEIAAYIRSNTIGV